MASSISRKKAKKLRLFSFWEEAEIVGSPWLRRAWQRSLSKTKTRSDLEIFRTELERSGVRVPGHIFCNCEMTGGNDISLIYPWVQVSFDSMEINSWITRQEEETVEEVSSPTLSRTLSQDISPATTSRSMQNETTRKLIQGTYCIVETLVPSQEIFADNDQLVVLLGFRTTDDNCVDTLAADEERSEEARSWREWTGIGNLYNGLARLNTVQINKIEFLESHIPDHTAVFHYLILLYLQVDCEMGRLSVLDAVARFRVRQMSGYVTLYSTVQEMTSYSEESSLTDSFQHQPKDKMLRKVAEDKQHLKEARNQFLQN